MATVNITQDFDKLPAELQRQVDDYVRFLLERYVYKPGEAEESEEDWFWRMIGLLDFEQESNQEIIAPLVTHLTGLEDEAIFLFDDVLSDKLKALDTPEHYEAAAKGMAGTADMFLYARCEVVANGKQFYEQVLNNPKDFLENGDLEEPLKLGNGAANNILVAGRSNLG
ncbi:MAG: DUF4240 domain-containing protein, partial [Bacteroidota bacterium]